MRNQRAAPATRRRLEIDRSHHIASDVAPGAAESARRREAREWLRTGAGAFVTTRIEAVLAWSRKHSLSPYPFVGGCCSPELEAVRGPRHDVDRFGCSVPQSSPRHADLLMVVGTVTHRQSPALKRAYDQMAEPKWVVAFGACACSGGPYDNYATVQGADSIVPVDVYIPGCRRGPRPCSTA